MKDNGAGISEEKMPHVYVEGIGLSNVRERLSVQFEGRAGLAAGPRESEWVSEITLPEIHASPNRHSARRMASWAAA